jgi:endonuclease/exonuclease/phosphatase family metal-dependent hydrolase
VIRLATANVLFGMSLTTGQSDIGSMTEAIRGLDADICALQEVDRHQMRSGGVDQTAAVATAMGASWCFAPAIVGEPGGRWRPAELGDAASVGASGVPTSNATHAVPAYGIALLSRHRVRSWHTFVLAAAPVSSPILNPATGRLMLLRDEPRVAIVAVLDVGGFALTVAATHLSFVPGWNVRQLRQLARSLRAFPGPCVLLGDLNLPRPLPERILRGRAVRRGLPWAQFGVSPVVRRNKSIDVANPDLSRELLGWHATVVGATFPAPAPKVQLDHVLVRANSGLEVVGSEVVHLAISDHRALVVDLQFGAGSKSGVDGVHG